MKYSHATTVSVLLTGLLLSMGQAQAGKPFNTLKGGQKAPANNYIGASIGSSDSAAICNSQLTTCKDEDNSWKVYSGVRVNDNLVIEGGYIQFGDLLAYDANSNRSTSGLSGYTTAGLATYQYSDQIELFGKGGMIWWDNESTTPNGKSENDGTGSFLGVGANYDMGDNLGVRAEWERYQGIERFQGEAGSMDLLSLGVTMSSL